MRMYVFKDHNPEETVGEILFDKDMGVVTMRDKINQEEVKNIFGNVAVTVSEKDMDEDKMFTTFTIYNWAVKTK